MSADENAHKAKILDVYWPIIEAARLVRDHYLNNPCGQIIICPDVSGDMIVALNNAEKQMNVQRSD